MSAANTFVGPVTEHELEAKAVAPRVTEVRLNAVIASTHYFTAAEGVAQADSCYGAPGDPGPAVLKLLTFCVLVLHNGFTVTGQSACASPENFDPEIGKRLALANAKNKMWDLEGYLLKQSLHEQALAREARGVTEAAARLDRE